MDKSTGVQVLSQMPFLFLIRYSLLLERVSSFFVILKSLWRELLFNFWMTIRFILKQLFGLTFYDSRQGDDRNFKLVTCLIDKKKNAKA